MSRPKLGKEIFQKQHQNKSHRSPIVGNEVGDRRAVAVSDAGGFEGVGTDAVAGHERALSAVARAVLQVKRGGNNGHKMLK